MKAASPLAARGRHASHFGRLAFALAVATAAAAPSAQEATLKRLLMLDVELIDSMQGSVPFPEKQARLAKATEQLRDAFIRERFYQVLDDAPVLSQIHSAQASFNFVDCNGCELEIARIAHADRVLVAWVQRVSNLILNINIEIRDVATGNVVLGKSVDLRGNTDVSWQRGIDFMVRDMREKRQGNR